MTTNMELVDLLKFGRYQMYQYFIICVPIMIVSMMNVNYIFVAEDVDHRCRVPECDIHDSTLSVEIPEYWPKDIDARCYRPVLNKEKYFENGTCSNETFTATVEECNEWIYEHNNSIVSELNLGCHSWKSTLVGTIHNTGMMFSMSVAGWIADKYGRKPALIICSVGGLVGVIKMFLSNYSTYLVVEFLETLLASGLYTVGIVIMIEVGGNSKRVVTGVVFSYAIYIGEVFFALIAMGVQYWKYIVAIVYAPTALFVLYIFVLKESMRWQLVNEKISEVKETLKFVARVNNISVTDKEIDDLSGDELTKKLDAIKQSETENLKDVLSSKEMTVRLAVASFCFFTSSFVYYGLAIHSVLLPGNKYTNFVLASVTSFPSDLLALYVLDKYGRKLTLQCSYAFLAVFLTAASFSPENLSWLTVLLFLLGKLGAVICFTGVYTFALELFPTSVRGTLFGICNTTARIGSLLAPLTVLLRSEFKALPSLLFSSTALIAALLLIFTPETKTLPMFDTIAQIEFHKKENKDSVQGIDNLGLEHVKNIKV
ncbi:organic cation transporter protein-like [Aricia agestis]|uniref:organic cation transporter protein-like n=1 Tax=Aricia agestis TaxID=91739 RepID=UPI001C208F3E|nr:organic cation transporter protein-like [Aricia agestis]